jgi:hypothetical protein
MMPKPVRRLPGSSPRMRAQPAVDMRARTVGGAAPVAGRKARQADRIGYRAIAALNACAHWKKLRVS